MFEVGDRQAGVSRRLPPCEVARIDMWLKRLADRVPKNVTEELAEVSVRCDALGKQHRYTAVARCGGRIGGCGRGLSAGVSEGNHGAEGLAPDQPRVKRQKAWIQRYPA